VTPELTSEPTLETLSIPEVKLDTPELTPEVKLETPELTPEVKLETAELTPELTLSDGDGDDVGDIYSNFGVSIFVLYIYILFKKKYRKNNHTS